jgi:hypothetical protein
VSEKKVVYVIHSDGRMCICAVPASAAIIPEMENEGDSRAIHVFDASSSVSSSEPAQSNAFLILTSSGSNTSYKQTERRSVHRCVIPSYIHQGGIATLLSTFQCNL